MSMRYFADNPQGYELEVQTNELDKDGTVSILEYIKRGHIPDWNHVKGEDADGEEITLPNENFPLHMAMHVAIKAVEEIEKYNPDFFRECEEYAESFCN